MPQEINITELLPLAKSPVRQKVEYMLEERESRFSLERAVSKLSPEVFESPESADELIALGRLAWQDRD